MGWDDSRKRTMAEGEKSLSYAVEANALFRTTMSDKSVVETLQGINMTLFAVFFARSLI